MGMTLIEKIFAKHSGLDVVVPGEIVTAKPDFSMVNDATMRLNTDLIYNQLGASELADPEKVVVVLDHQVPADTPQTAEVHRLSKEFAERFGITRFHQADGICHQVLLENYILPGQLMVGADSHSPSAGAIGCAGIGMGSTDICATMIQGESWFKVPETVKVVLTGALQKSVYPKDIILRVIKEVGGGGFAYQAVEFQGDGVESLTVSQRFTLCNMTAEAGAKTGLVAADDVVVEYLKAQRGIDFKIEPWMRADADAEYSRVVTIDLSSLEPQIACPHTVDNVHDIGDVDKVKLDQVFIGSCTNGRIDDLRIAAELLNGKKVNPELRFIVAPASVDTYKQAMREGIIEILLDSGAQIQHPGCSTCWGACQGVLASGQKMISTQNRNFRGRSGSSEAEIYLASPEVVAASAIMGEITDPRSI